MGVKKSIRKAAARTWGKSHGPDFQVYTSPDPFLYPALAGVKTYVNNTYMVMVKDIETEWGLAKHLHIQRMDTNRVRSWRALQDVKNALCGPESVAVEMFPEEGEVVDDHHHYHLWVLPDGLRLPFRIGGRP